MNADELKAMLADHELWLTRKGGKRADLCWANLSAAELRSANLSAAELRSANLSAAELRSANLSAADLCWANMSEVNLSKANLTNADLRGVKLSKADLTNADLRGVNLSAANLSGAVGIIYAQCSFTAHGESSRQLSGVVIGDELRLFCGCFQGTLAELDAYIDNGEERYKPTRKLARNFIVAAIDAARKAQP